MTRIVKEPATRRREIIEVANTLFKFRGYEATSVENIIGDAGIAKGTFYYYFKSKSEVLDAVVEDISVQIYELIKTISRRENLSPMDKLDQVFIGKKKKQIVDDKIMKAVDEPENRELQERLNIYYIDKIVPLIADIFNQGQAEGLWQRNISVQNAQTILGGYQFIMDSGLFKLNDKQREEYLKETEKLVETVLGAEQGAFKTIFSAV